MIYDFLIDQLEGVCGLTGGVYPPGVCIDDVEPPFAVYFFEQTTAARDLSGAVHHYTDTIRVDFIGEHYDAIFSIWAEARDMLQNVSNLDTGHGEYVFSVSCGAADADTADVDTDLMRKSLMITVLWCPLPEDGSGENTEEQNAI